MSQNSDEKSKAVLELNDQMVKEICDGVHKVLLSVFQIHPTAGKHFVAQDHTGHGDVSGFVTLTQERLEGALVVSFPAASIFGFMKNLYRKDFAVIDKSVRQGVGEITNMIFGVLKTNLKNSGYAFKMVIPSVLTSDGGVNSAGTPQQVAIYMPGKTLVIPFESEVGPFTVMLLIYPEELVSFKVA